MPQRHESSTALKRCSRCKRMLERDCFGSDRSRGDGLHARCRICNRALDRVRDRATRDTPEGRATTKANNDKMTPERRAVQHLKYRAANLTKYRARDIVTQALRSGVLIRQPCERCGDEKSQCHHEDYSRPLDVTFLCARCHGHRHREIFDECRVAELGLR